LQDPVSKIKTKKFNYKYYMLSLWQSYRLVIPEANEMRNQWAARFGEKIENKAKNRQSKSHPACLSSEEIL
jgi:hypothetical protein